MEISRRSPRGYPSLATPTILRELLRGGILSPVLSICPYLPCTYPMSVRSATLRAPSRRFDDPDDDVYTRRTDHRRSLLIVAVRAFRDLARMDVNQSGPRR